MDKFIVADNIAKLVCEVSNPTEGPYKVTVIIESPEGKVLSTNTVRSIFAQARQEIRNPPFIEFKELKEFG